MVGCSAKRCWIVCRRLRSNSRRARRSTSRSASWPPCGSHSRKRSGRLSPTVAAGTAPLPASSSTGSRRGRPCCASISPLTSRGTSSCCSARRTATTARTAHRARSGEQGPPPRTRLPAIRMTLPRVAPGPLPRPAPSPRSKPGRTTTEPHKEITMEIRPDQFPNGHGQSGGTCFHKRVAQSARVLPLPWPGDEEADAAADACDEVGLAALAGARDPLDQIRSRWRVPFDPVESRKIYERVVTPAWTLAKRMTTAYGARGKLFMDRDVRRVLWPVAAHVAYTVVSDDEQRAFIEATGGL